MRLYFKDPEGSKLAIETELQQYCMNFAEGCTEIDETKHRFIEVQSHEDLINIYSELDFCTWGYGDAWLKDYEAWRDGDAYESEELPFC